MSNDEQRRSIVAEVIEVAWSGEVYRTALLADPAGVLRAAGAALPEGVEVIVLEDSAELTHIAVPAEVSAADADRIAGDIASLLPLPDGHEVRLLQSTIATHYLVLPLPPEGRELSEEELDEVSGGGSGGKGGVGYYPIVGGTSGNGGNAGLFA